MAVKSRKFDMQCSLVCGDRHTNFLSYMPEKFYKVHTLQESEGSESSVGAIVLIHGPSVERSDSSMAAVVICIKDRDTVASWRNIGHAEGLHTDDSIAKFLIQLYQQVRETDTEAGLCCVKCSHVLLLSVPCAPSCQDTLQPLASRSCHIPGDNDSGLDPPSDDCDSDDTWPLSETADPLSEVGFVSCEKPGEGRSEVATKTSPQATVDKGEWTQPAGPAGEVGEVGVKLAAKGEHSNSAGCPWGRWTAGVHPALSSSAGSQVFSVSVSRSDSASLESVMEEDQLAAPLSLSAADRIGKKGLFAGWAHNPEKQSVSSVQDCSYSAHPKQDLVATEEADVVKKQSGKEKIPHLQLDKDMNVDIASLLGMEAVSDHTCHVDMVRVLKRGSPQEELRTAEDMRVLADPRHTNGMNLRSAQTVGETDHSKGSPSSFVNDLCPLQELEDNSVKGQELQGNSVKGQELQGNSVKGEPSNQDMTSMKSARKVSKQETKCAKDFSDRKHLSGGRLQSAHKKRLKTKSKLVTSAAQGSVSSVSTTEVHDPHMCPVCKKCFSHKKTLRCHLFIHTDEKPYVCALCNTGFRQSSNLRNHLKTVHTAEKQIMCSQCPFTCKTNKSLKQHELLRHSGPLERSFQCSECRATFVTKSHLRRHELTHSGEKPYVCEDCGQAFSQKCNLKKHVAGTHKKSLDGSPLKSICKFMCDVCGKTFFACTSLVQHKARHSTDRPYSCELCSKSFKTRPVLKQHYRNLHSHLGPHPCPTCGKSFGTKAALNSHMKGHCTKRTFVCQVCGKAFKTQLRLRSHEMTHSQSGPFACDVCEKSFKTQYAVQQHRQRHLVSTEFLCDICGKAFKTCRSLRLHEATHSDTRLHSCEMCKKSFKTKIALYSHKITHSADKNFVCETCGKAFKRRYELTKHENRHLECRPHTCELCEKSFKTKYCLHSHKLTHTVSKEFACQTCGKEYKSRPSLLNHEATHADWRPHMCKICQKSFISGPSLKRHLLLHSGHCWVQEQQKVHMPSEPSSAIRHGTDCVT